MAARRVLTLSLAALVAAAIAIACFADLPSPDKCPPASSALDSTCVKEAGVDPMHPECLSQGFLACLLGASVDECSCPSGACPKVNGADCFPRDECPSAVASPGARCPKIEAPEVGCRCGCAACLSTCDGYGPVFGLTPIDAGLLPVVSVPLTNLPSSGHIAAYARVRGAGTIVLALVPGQGAAGGQVVTTPLSLNELTSGESPYHDVKIGGDIDITTLNGSADVVVLGETMGMGPPIVQVDCIVPVYTP